MQSIGYVRSEAQTILEGSFDDIIDIVAGILDEHQCDIDAYNKLVDQNADMEIEITNLNEVIKALEDKLQEVKDA